MVFRHRASDSNICRLIVFLLGKKKELLNTKGTKTSQHRINNVDSSESLYRHKNMMASYAGKH
jgi:hypothetical protein